MKPKTFYRVRISGKNSHADGPASEVVEFETAYSGKFCRILIQSELTFDILEVPIPTDLKTEVLDDNTIHIKFNAVRDPDDHSKALGVSSTHRRSTRRMSHLRQVAPDFRSSV